MSTCEPVHVPPGTPNVRWCSEWVALIIAGDPAGTPDAVLHWRSSTDVHGAVLTRCGTLGRALTLDGVYDDDHPVVACAACLRKLPTWQRRASTL